MRTDHLSLPMTEALAVFILLQSAYFAAGQTVYGGCQQDDYYGSLSDNAGRQEISNLLKTTHRNFLPYTSNREDTWDALMDLDPGSQPGTVKLIYSDHEPQGEAPSGQTRAWNREHLWPKSHGVGYDGADFTDVHHLRPADVNVNSARGNKYFGACGIVEPLDTCRSPAHSEAAASTSTDNEVWLPPTEVRGDIARALFYMELRYSGVGGDPKLELTDCPTEVSDTKLAYLSQLLEWHQADPVDDAERNRNDRVCERWQGNRNIFVDFPDLVGKLFGEPANPNQSNGYECSLGEPPTSSPVGSGSCSTLTAGDVQVIGVHSDNPDEIALVTLVNLPAGLELYLTDNGWTGTEFKTSEGTVKLTVPNGGLSSGTIFGFGEDSNLFLGPAWTPQTGALALSTQGDSVIVYCQPTEGEYNFLGAATTSNAWDPNQSDTSNSGLPPGLENANIALPHFDNYIYIGPSEGKKSDLAAAIGNEENWSGFDNFQPLTFDYSFSVESEVVSDCQGLKAGDVQIIGVHSDEPDEIALVALQDLPGNLELLLTDDAWTGNGFRGSEGTVKLTVPSGGIGKGSIFGFGIETSLPYGKSWSEVSGDFALSTQGDGLAAYCQPTKSTYNFLGALSFSGPWVEGGFSSSNGALPPGLENANVALPHFDNYIYIGPSQGTKSDLAAAIGNEENWSGFDNVQPLTFNYSFSVESEDVLDCQGLKAGDVQIIGVHSDEPDEIALVALQDLPGNLELLLTDDAWTGDGFRGSEGTVKLTVPSDGIGKGSIFGFGIESSLPYSKSWSEVSGGLALSTQGDGLAVYCQPTESTYNFLGALSFSGPWVEGGFSSSNGALPPGLKQASTALGHRDNFQYVGPVSGSRTELISAIGDESNWRGSNSAQAFVYDTSFTVTSGSFRDITPSGSTDENSASFTARISRICLLLVIILLWNM